MASKILWLLGKWKDVEVKGNNWKSYVCAKDLKPEKRAIMDQEGVKGG